MFYRFLLFLLFLLTFTVNEMLKHWLLKETPCDEEEEREMKRRKERLTDRPRHTWQIQKELITAVCVCVCFYKESKLEYYNYMLVKCTCVLQISWFPSVPSRFHCQWNVKTLITEGDTMWRRGWKRDEEKRDRQRHTWQIQKEWIKSVCVCMCMCMCVEILKLYVSEVYLCFTDFFFSFFSSSLSLSRKYKTLITDKEVERAMKRRKTDRDIHDRYKRSESELCVCVFVLFSVIWHQTYGKGPLR